MMRVDARVLFLSLSVLLMTGCPQQSATTSAAVGAIASLTATPVPTANSSNVTAIQIITQAGSSGSFNNAVVPVSGGVSVAASRLFDLTGAQIATSNIPSWFVSAHIFLTSTRTSAGTPTFSGEDTACAYFDSYSDNNPDSSGYYTIDGYNMGQTGIVSDIDQCAGTAAAELNQLGLYVQFDRRFMNATDKFNIIVKAMPIDAPNTAPTASSCVVGGNFNATNCSNQVYTLTRRTSPGAAAQPFYNLFPSAKALDLLSESILVPVADDTSITTISIDRVKGGAVFYGITVIKMQ